MNELSLNILDIAQNSLSAGATKVAIELTELPLEDRLILRVADNGCGMDEALLKKVVDPFTTTRTTRKVGLGIPLLKFAAESTGGSLTLKSEVGAGTELTAAFTLSHIDRAPLGDVASTLTALIQARPDVEFRYAHRVPGKSFELDTAEIRELMGDVPLDTPELLEWIREYVNEHEKDLNGGA